MWGTLMSDEMEHVWISCWNRPWYRNKYWIEPFWGDIQPFSMNFPKVIPQGILISVGLMRWGWYYIIRMREGVDGADSGIGMNIELNNLGAQPFLMTLRGLKLLTCKSVMERAMMKWVMYVGRCWWSRQWYWNIWCFLLPRKGVDWSGSMYWTYI